MLDYYFRVQNIFQHFVHYLQDMLYGILKKGNSSIVTGRGCPISKGISTQG